MRDVFTGLFELQREYLEHVRKRLGSDGAHPGQGPILCLLLAMDSVSQADLVRGLGVTAATVAVSITRLERLGYVRRERNQHNQRANVLKLTQEGRVQAEKLQQAMCEACLQAVAGVSEADLTRFGALIAQMLDNLRQSGTSAELSNKP